MKLQTVRIHVRKCKLRVRGVSASNEKASRQKSPMRERETADAGGGGGRTRDGRARKHLQRIGLTRVFNPARGFLVGEIKRGQVKRDAKKIARARAMHTERNREHKGFAQREAREEGGEVPRRDKRGRSLR